MEEEVWMPVVTWMNGEKYDFTGYYEVSDLGTICGVERIDSIGRLRKRKTKKPQIGKSDYYIVGLSKNGKLKSFSVAKIVYESFNGTVPEGMQVNHINEDKHDNRLENLNLMTPKENTNWGTHNYRAAKAQQNRGDLSKEVEQYDLEGNLIKVWPSAKEVQRVLGLKNSNIIACCNGRRNKRGYLYKTVGGFIWRHPKIEKEAV